MKEYFVDVQYVEYDIITVEAKNEKEAREKVGKQVCTLDNKNKYDKINILDAYE